MILKEGYIMKWLVEWEDEEQAQAFDRESTDWRLLYGYEYK